MWHLRHSTGEDDSEKRFRRRRNEWLAKRGRKPSREPEPEDSDEKPELFEDLTDLWNDWHTLSMSRPSGMSPAGIPWGEFSRYAEDHGRHGEERLRFCRLMKAMDTAWLVETSKRRKEKRDDHDRSRDQGRLDKPPARSEAGRDGAR